MAALRRVFRALQPSPRLVLLSDAGQWAAGCALWPGVAAAYVHVDDFGVMGAEGDEADLVVSYIEKDLAQLGFRLKSVRAGAVERFVGYHPARALVG
eukprot:15451700-Alexandrium_andersonii.AAC.1